MTDPGFGAVQTSTIFSNAISATIPVAAAAGDRFLVAATAQGGTDLSTGPVDCELLETFAPSASTGRGWIWTGIVGDTANLDPGDTLTVTMTGNSSLTMAVYAAGGPADVQDSQVGATATMGASPPFVKTSPGGTALSAARAVHFYGICAHVASEVPTWTADAATTERADLTMEGGTRYATMLVADEAVSTGTVAGRTATASHRLQSAAATVILATSTAQPVADAGPDQNVAAGATVNLDGTASDGGGAGGPYAYLWTQISGPPVALSSTVAEDPSFTAPSTSATLVFQLTVADVTPVASLPDTVIITVTGPGAVARPIEDIAFTGWTHEPSGTPNASGDNNDGTWDAWTGVFGAVDTWERKLSTWIPTPGLGGQIGFRLRAIGANGSATIQLRQGASTVITTSAPQTWSLPGEAVQFDITISAAEVASISDPADLRLRLIGELIDPGA